MSRRIRFHPPDCLVEVTCRTVQGRFLLRPSAPVADLCRGVLARAVRLYPVRIHAFTFLANHYHLLLTAPSASRLAAFMNYLNSNIAREIGRAVGWREKFWGRRYQAILVSPEQEAQVERLRYLLSHGSKENLVRRPADWPGATAIRSLLTGDPVVGSWVDRTASYLAHRQRRPFEPRNFVSVESFELAPLPCWNHLTREAHQARVAELVRGIEQETDRRIRETGREPLGRERLERQPPHQFPDRLKKTPAPLVHAASKPVRDAFRTAYRLFVHAFRKASEKLRSGRPLPSLLELFPVGSFPPPGPFIAAPSAGLS
jgi:REP element-mobilizing transposase RayT